MIMDAQLVFSDSQALTATAASGNQIDLGPLYSGNTGRNIGVGKQLYVAINCEVAMTDAGSDSTVTVTLETDDNSAFSTALTVGTLGSIPALSAAGSTFFFPLPIGASVPYERYIQLRYTMVNGNLTTGTFSASIVETAPVWQSYAQGSPGTGY